MNISRSQYLFDLVYIRFIALAILHCNTLPLAFHCVVYVM